MTVASTTNRNDYLGTGTTDTYSYNFRVLESSDLKVIKRVISTDVESVLTLGVDYTISGVNEVSGGSVTLLAGNLPATEALTIRRVLPLTQGSDFRNQGEFLAEVHEDQFDRDTMVKQQQQDELDRSAKLPESIDPATFNVDLPNLVGKVNVTIMTNATGDGFEEGPSVEDLAAVEPNAIAAAASAQAASDSAAAAAADLVLTNADVVSTNADAATCTALAASIGSLDSLSDVTITSPATDEVVTYTGSGFENKPIVKYDILTADGALSAGDVVSVSATGAKKIVYATNPYEYVGVAMETVTTGNPVQVAFDGDTVTGLSGLTVGAKVYMQSDSTVGSTATAYPIGVATSATTARIGGFSKVISTLDTGSTSQSIGTNSQTSDLSHAFTGNCTVVARDANPIAISCNAEMSNTYIVAGEQNYQVKLYVGIYRDATLIGKMGIPFLRTRTEGTGVGVMEVAGLVFYDSTAKTPGTSYEYTFTFFGRYGTSTILTPGGEGNIIFTARQL